LRDRQKPGDKRMHERPETPYEQLYNGFRWKVPKHFNIAEACCTRWARETPDAIAVHYEHENGETLSCSYASLQAQANRLSHALQRLGVQQGDRVAIVMPQRVETAVAHMAIYQLGAVAMPLSMLFGPDALAYRLQNSEARLAIVDEGGIENLLAARADCPDLQTVVAVGGAQGRGDADGRNFRFRQGRGKRIFTCGKLSQKIFRDHSYVEYVRGCLAVYFTGNGIFGLIFYFEAA
jgi:acetyl-CoA synthetase